MTRIRTQATACNPEKIAAYAENYEPPKRTPEYAAWAKIRTLHHAELTFEEFLTELGPRPSPQHILIRKNVRRAYRKGNLRWAPSEEKGHTIPPELSLFIHQGAATAKLSGRRKATSRFVGVCWDKSRGEWLAQIRRNNRSKNLGRYPNEVDAALAYDEAVRKYFGPAAICNFRLDDKPAKKR
jgi:hypothetical protein